MLLLFILQNVYADKICNLPDYPRILNINDTAMGYIISEKGVHDLIANGMDFAVTFLHMITIPDVTFPINLGIIQINFQIKDIVFDTLTVGSVEAQLTGNSNMTAALKGMHAAIKFTWAFQEMQAPYLSDSGTGVILVDGMDLQITIETTMDPDCPGHLKILVHRATIGIQSIKLNLDGGNSVIYQSMINLIMQSVTDKLQDMLQQVMINLIQEMMDNYIAGSGYYQEYLSAPGIYVDDRFTAPLEVGYKYIAIRYSGYTYYWDNKSDEFIQPSMMIQNVPFNYINSVYQFLVYQAGFQNNLYIMHKYKKAFDVPNMFTNTEMPKIIIQGNGVLLTFKGIANDTEIEINMKGTYNQHTDLQHDDDLGVRNVTYIYFDLTYFNHTISGQQSPNLDISKLIQNLPGELTKLYKLYGYMINNTPFMELDKFLPVYDQEWQVIRIFHPNDMIETEKETKPKSISV